MDCSLVAAVHCTSPDNFRYACAELDTSSLAYRAGVTHAITAPKSYSFISGLSTAFLLGAAHRLEKGAVAQRVAALHVNLYHGADLSVSTYIAALRRLLLDAKTGGEWFSKAAKVRTPWPSSGDLFSNGVIRARYRLSSTLQALTLLLPCST